MGVELWGTYDDMLSLYEVISKFWNQKTESNIDGYENRNTLISGFSYEIRKAISGSRLTSATSHITGELIPQLGVKFSWVHFLFSLTAIRYNTKYYKVSKLDTATLKLLEYWLEKAMLDYDKKGGEELSYFIDGKIDATNEFLYQYMRSINMDFFRSSGYKKNFRLLPTIMRRSIEITQEYKHFRMQLKEDAEKLKVPTWELEFDDKSINYGDERW